MDAPTRNPAAMTTLNDGSAPCTSDALLARLAELGIDAPTQDHEAVFTVNEAAALQHQQPGAHTKNLFLRNKKGRMWLVTVEAHRPVDLKALGQALGAGRLSFGSEERLMAWLGLTAGSVTPLAVINDPTGAVTLAIDSDLLQADLVNVHPLTNTRTTALRPDDLVRFCAACDHDPILVQLE